MGSPREHSRVPIVCQAANHCQHFRVGGDAHRWPVSTEESCIDEPGEKVCLRAIVWASPRNPYLEKPLHKVKDKFADLGTLRSPEDVGMPAARALTSSRAAVRLRLAAMSRHAAAIHAEVTGAHVPPRTWAFAPFDSWWSAVDTVSADRTAELIQLTAHHRHYPAPVPFPNGQLSPKGSRSGFGIGHDAHSVRSMLVY